MKIYRNRFLICDSEWNYLLVKPVFWAVWETHFINEYQKLQNEISLKDNLSDFYFELAKKTKTVIERIENGNFIDLSVC